MFYRTQKFLRKNIFLTCLGISSAILFIKILIIPDELEFIEPISIYTALLSSVIFIYGFIIAPAVAEYKESERIRSELKTLIENILLDIEHYQGLTKNLNTDIFYTSFSELLMIVFEKVADGKKQKSVKEVIEKTTPFFIEAEKSGITPNHIIRTKQEISQLRRTIIRLFQIRDTESLPRVVHNLKNFITLFIISTLLFLNIGNESVEGLFVEIKEGIVIFILSFVYAYLSLIITNLENPFDKRNYTDYIDMGFLKDYAEKILP